MKEAGLDIIVHASADEEALQQELVGLLKNTPIKDDELLANLGIFLTSKNLARILFFYELYKRVAPLHGVAMEFGTRWGQIITVLTALRGLFEPFNRIRKMVAFDTFEGLKGMSVHDTGANKCTDGAYTVPAGYEKYLDRILAIHEGLNPMSHKKKYELLKGDILETLPSYLTAHPETMISLAVFDMDIYVPTVETLKTIEPYLCKGSILVFDELCDDVFPGETVALRETLGLRNCKVERFPMTSRLSYLVVE